MRNAKWHEMGVTGHPWMLLPPMTSTLAAQCQRCLFAHLSGQVLFLHKHTHISMSADGQQLLALKKIVCTLASFMILFRLALKVLPAHSGAPRRGNPFGRVKAKCRVPLSHMCYIFDRESQPETG